MGSWDHWSDRQQCKLRDELVREQVRAVAAGSPYWKQRLAELGRTAGTVDGVGALSTLPAAGERDVSPAGDPAAMADLVMRGGERQFALHALGPVLRKALMLRATNAARYRRVVEAETQPTSYVWAGLGFRFPLASTRGDVDVIARAGVRLFRVVGVTRADSLLSALPTASSVEHNALQFAALADGVPAVFAGDRLDSVVAAARLLPPTVLAVSVADAGDMLGRLVAAAVGFERLRTLLLVGAPNDSERELAHQALRDAGAGDAVVLAVHAPSGARLLWGECRESGGSGGLHSYPDLDVAQVIDPETGDGVADGGNGELVLTQLTMRGSALVRWRTADLVDAIDASSCPGCGRTVPRMLGTRRGALVVPTDNGRPLDLRALAGALTGRADVTDWRVVLGRRERDGRDQIVVHLGTAGDPGEAAVAAAADIRALTGLLPHQLVSAGADELDSVDGRPLTRRVLLR